MPTDATASFSIELDTKGASKSSEEAAAALEQLKAKIIAGNEQLYAMNQAMKNLKGGGLVAIDAITTLKDQISAQKASIASAQVGYSELGGSLTVLSKAAKAATDDEKALRKALEDQAKAAKTELAASEKLATEKHQALVEAFRTGNGPLAATMGKVKGLGAMLGKGGLAGVAVLAAAAILAVAAAAVAGMVALVAYGLASANAARSELLHLQGLTTIRNWYGVAAGKATDLRDAINTVSQSSALGKDKIAGYAEQLYKMGLRGEKLSDALDATAIKASVQGDEWASVFMQMAAATNATGGSVKKLSDDVRTRLGGIAKAQALDLGVQMHKLHESFSALFEDVDIEGFLSALRSVTSLFSQSTITGRALKDLMETLLNPLFSSVGTLAPVMVDFFQGMVVGAQEVVIAILEVQLWLKRTFGKSKDLLGMKDAFDMGVVSIQVFTIALLVLAAVVAAFGAIVYAVFFKLPKIVGEALGDLAFFLTDKATFERVGSSIVQGVADGIKAGAKWVWDAIKDLAAGAKKAFMSLLKMGSPSIVFAELGINIPRGLARGVDAGRPAVDRSIRTMALRTAEVGSGALSAANSNAAPAGRTHVEIHEIHYHAAAGEDPVAGAQNFAAELAKSLEAAGIHKGAA